MPNEDWDDIHEWLAREGEESNDRADAAFARAMARLPKIAPQDGFADRVVLMAYGTVRRRQTLHRLTWAAGVVFTAALMVAAFWITNAASWVSEAAAAIVVRAFTSTAMLASTSLQWLAMYARVGGTLQAALATPEATLIVLGVELTGILAFVGLKYLLAQSPSVERVL